MIERHVILGWYTMFKVMWPGLGLLDVGRSWRMIDLLSRMCYETGIAKTHQKVILRIRVHNS